MAHSFQVIASLDSIRSSRSITYEYPLLIFHLQKCWWDPLESGKIHFNLKCTLRLPLSCLSISAHCTWLLKTAEPSMSYSPKVVFGLQPSCLNCIAWMTGLWFCFFFFLWETFLWQKYHWYWCLELLIHSSCLPLPQKENRERQFLVFHERVKQTSAGGRIKWLSILFLHIFVLWYDYEVVLGNPV